MERKDHAFYPEFNCEIGNPWTGEAFSSCQFIIISFTMNYPEQQQAKARSIGVLEGPKIPNSESPQAETDQIISSGKSNKQ
jgi:hypothetical protein